MTMSKSRGVLFVLLVAGVLWGISLATWQAGTPGESLGPAGVANLNPEATTQTSPIITSCVAIIAVCGLLAAMLGKIGRFVILSFAAIATIGYGITAVSTLGMPGATGWPVFALTAAIAGLIVIGIVLFASAEWSNSNRYDRRAQANSADFDTTSTWDALSRGEDIDDSGTNSDSLTEETDSPAEDTESPAEDTEPESEEPEPESGDKNSESGDDHKSTSG